MLRPSRRALELAESFSLGLDSAPPPVLSGERLARAGGSSSEFHDRRPYQVGDDVRRIDWPAFARSDQLFVRVWREELLARVEVLLDVSRSMAIDSAKAALAVDLAALIAMGARRDGCAARIVAIGDRPRPVEIDELLGAGIEFEARAPSDATIHEASELVRRGSMVVLVSDFLYPHDARALLAPLSARAGALACVQVLASAERAPSTGSAQRMIDCESGREVDLVVDSHAVAGYRRRLAALIEGLERECRRAHAAFASLTADREIETLARGELTLAGVLAPR